MRSAGFPVGGVLSLTPAGLADAADAALRSPADPVAAQAFEKRWHEAAEESSGVLAGIARTERFRLAVAWQNHPVLETAIAPLLRHAGSRNGRQRARERLVAAYWQRYCVKNETIGFFGPLAWARIDPLRTASAQRCGDRVVDRARVHLETWGVALLAGQLARDPALRPWLCPRRVPALRLDGDRVCRPDGTRELLSANDLALLAAADGSTTANELAARLPALDVPAGLTELSRRGLLVWDWALPAGTALEEELAEALRALPDAELTARIGAPLDRLRAVRAELEHGWDEPTAVVAGLAKLGALFTEATGAPPNRSAGRAYAGRTLAYLECRRGVSVELGTDFLDALAPLGLLLDSVRWLTARIRALVLPQIQEAYTRVAARDDAPVTAATLWFACAPTLAASLDGLLAAAVGELHERWRRLLPYGDGDTDVRVTAESLRAGVLREFGAAGPGWAEARWCSPDVLIAAPGLAEFARGDGVLVLGELHAAMNATDYLATVAEHPAPDALLSAVDADFPLPRLLLGPATGVSMRNFPALIRPGDRWLALVPRQPLPRRGTVVAAGDLAVVGTGTDLRLVDGDAEFDVLDLFAEAIKGRLLRHFTLFPASLFHGGRRPRITIDRLVVARRSWSFPAAELSFAGKYSEIERFLDARSWWARHGLPRFAFVKTPAETKPVYVDFASPVYVEVLAELVRRAARTGASVAFVEMLPGPEQCWLADSEGQRYAAEIRLVAVDGQGCG